jgi:uncharacterized protein YyaL (SSP411 family)
MLKPFITLFVLISFFVLSANAQSADKSKTSDKSTPKKAETTTTAKPAQTEPFKWYVWNEGYPLAAKKNKILIVDIYTDWCGWCKKMDKDTYAKKSIIDKINKDFVLVKFNPEKSFSDYEIEGIKYNNSQLFGMLCNNQRVGYPTTVFLYPDSKKIFLVSGYQDEANFTKTLEYYLSQKGK